MSLQRFSLRCVLIPSVGANLVFALLAPPEVLAYHVSERAQARLQRLLALNAAGMLGEAEQLELDELQRIEHLLIMLKAQIAGHVQQEPCCPRRCRPVCAN